MELDLGIFCSRLLTMAPSCQMQEKMFIGMRAGRIALVCPQDSLPADLTIQETIHGTHHLAMPSLVNGHTHLPMTLLRGLGDDAPLQEWLHGTIFPLEAAHVSPEFVRVGSELALLESIRFGVTCFSDMYFFADSIARVLDKAGVRGVVAEGFLDFPTPDNKALDGGSDRRFGELFAEFRNHPRVRPAVAAHAPYTCSDATIQRVHSLAESHGVPFLMHLAETRWEVEGQLRDHGKTPVERLYDLGVVNRNSQFAHGVHLTDSDIGLLAEGRSAVIYNPESNMKLGSGICPVRRLREAGVRMGLGTDGAASNNNLNLFSEMDTGAKLQKLAESDSAAMTARHALALATREGAEAIGFSECGVLEPGRCADLILVDLDHPHLTPMHDVFSQLVYSATGCEVSTVICAGRILFHAGEYLTLDKEKIIAEAKELSRRFK